MKAKSKPMVKAQKVSKPPKKADSYTVKLDLQGRIVIPAPVRKALRLKAGDNVTCTLRGSELALTFKRRSS